MKFLPISCLMLTIALVSSRVFAQSGETADAAVRINDAIKAKSAKEQMPIFTAIHEQYSNKPEAVPENIRKALGEFLYRSAAGQGPQRTTSPMHGRGRSPDDFPMLVALRFADPASMMTMEGSALLATRKEYPAGIRGRAVDLLAKGERLDLLQQVARELQTSPEQNAAESTDNVEKKIRDEALRRIRELEN